MEFKSLKKEEAELMSYKDLTYLILKGRTRSIKTKDLLSMIVKKLGLSEDVIVDKIGDYYSILNSDKRFILLDGGKWNLSERYDSSYKLKEEYEDDEDEDLLMLAEEEEEEDSVLEYSGSASEDLNPDDDDDLDDLTIMSDEDDME